MSYHFAPAAELPITHADHNWEEWHAYLSTDETRAEFPPHVDDNSTGICCHDCQTIVVDQPVRLWVQ